MVFIIFYLMTVHNRNIKLIIVSFMIYYMSCVILKTTDNHKTNFRKIINVKKKQYSTKMMIDKLLKKCCKGMSYNKNYNNDRKLKCTRIFFLQ